MKINFTPIVRGLDRSVADTAQTPGGLRDVLNLLPEVTGRLDGVFRSPSAIVSSTGTPIRWTQWDDSTVICKKNPAGDVQVGAFLGPTESATATPYRTVCMTTGAQSYVMTSKTNPFVDRVYLQKDSGTGWGDCTLTGGGTITVTFNGTQRRPLNTDGTTPQYIIFDADTAEGSTTAKIRACINPTYTAGDPTQEMLTVQYVGDTVANVTRAYIVYGASSTDTFAPDCFSPWRNRICAGLDNEVYFGGFIGQASPFVASDQNDWGYWYELNSVKVGNSASGKIVRLEPLGDDLIVFLERATYRLYGKPPINGAFDNQVVVEEVNPVRGINVYDAVGRSPDGNILFVAANDGQCYAFDGKYTLISQKIRSHPRFININHVQCSERYAIFTGTVVDPSRVPYEIDPKEGGLLFQNTPAFVLNIATSTWSVLDQWSTTDNLILTPVSDPHEMGIFGAFKTNGVFEIALTEPDGIHIVNDRTIANPQLKYTLTCGLATHQIPATPTFRADSISVLAETPYVNRLSGVLPAEDPCGTAPLIQMRDVPVNSFGQTKRYGLHSNRPEQHNFVSAAIGYWGEKLLNGMDYYTTTTAITIDSTQTLQKITNNASQHIDRIDLLLSDLVSCRITLYEDNNGIPGDVIYYTDCVVPQNGIINTTDKYWRSFGINGSVPAVFWVGISGNCIAYRYPANAEIRKDLTGSGTTDSTTNPDEFTGTGTTFITDGVVPGDILVLSPSEAGSYTILTVASETVLEVADGSFSTNVGTDFTINRTIHNGEAFAIRILEEAGGCFSAKAILDIKVVGEGLPYDY